MLRLATVKDVDAMYGLFEKYIEETHNQIASNEEYTKTFLYKHVIHANALSLLLIKEDKVQGMLLALCDWHPFLQERMATEYIWWVNTAYRSKESLRMLDAYEYWAHYEMKADKICLSSTTDKRIGKLFQRRGYLQKEIAWERM